MVNVMTYKISSVIALAEPLLSPTRLLGRGELLPRLGAVPEMPGVYAVWKERLGSTCWSLLEAEVGKLG